MILGSKKKKVKKGREGETKWKWLRTEKWKSWRRREILQRRIRRGESKRKK
jgi:hypothetical protein